MKGWPRSSPARGGGDPHAHAGNPGHHAAGSALCGCRHRGQRIPARAGPAGRGGGDCRERIWIDPGFGFGKTLEHNLTLFPGAGRACGHGSSGWWQGSPASRWWDWSRPSGEERLVGSAVFHFAALERGARILRVHDVAAAADAVAVYRALFPRPEAVFPPRRSPRSPAWGGRADRRSGKGDQPVKEGKRSIAEVRFFPDAVAPEPAGDSENVK